MAFNLIDSVSGLFSGDLISKTASALGENESNIQKAVGASVPSVLAGLLAKAGNTDSLNSIFNMAKQADNSSVLGNLGGLLGSAGGSLSGILGMAQNIFGDKLGNLANVISNFSGIKSSSASSLLNVVTPAALGTMGRHIKETGMGPSGFAGFLSSQKDAILSAVPSGLNLAGALGLGSLSGIGSKLGSLFSGTSENIGRTIAPVKETAKKSSGSFWLIIFILAIIALIFYFMRGCGNETTQTPVLPMPGVDTPATVSYKVKLPDGVELDAYKGGIEDELVKYLNSDEPISKDRWFDFDNLNFESGSATISASSNQQIQNIAAILKAYPNAKIKIGAYTDNTGDSVANVKLSQERADAVLNKLKESVNAEQLTSAEGYGPAHFVAPNDTEENRKKNRRISVNVREK